MPECPMTEPDDLPPFSLPPPDVAQVASVVLRMPEHQHLVDNDVSIGWLMRNDTKHKGNKVELGSVHDVGAIFQGGFKALGLQLLAGMLGELPTFLVVLDAGFWGGASDTERQALVFHELAHVQQALDRFGAPRFDRDGLPVFKVVEHDVSAFNSEVARFGAWSPDLRAFVAIAQR